MIPQPTLDVNDVLLSIVIVSYNTRALTIECLRSVFQQTKKTSFEVIVLDNGSTDGTIRAIEAEFKGKVKLLRSEENLGFAAGTNKAVHATHGELLLLLNPDTVVLDHAIDKVVSFSIEKCDYGVWGGRTVFSDGSLNPASCWSRQTLWSLIMQATGLSSIFKSFTIFNPEGLGGWDREGIREVDIVSGCFLLIRRDLWDRLGGFREMFFMYGEEADLCLRARLLGARPIITSESTIIHYGGASDTIRADKLVRLLKAKMSLIRMHFPKHQQAMGCWLLSLWPKSRKMVHAILSVFGFSSSQQKYEVWKLVVLRKKEWSSGYKY